MLLYAAAIRSGSPLCRARTSFASYDDRAAAAVSNFWTYSGTSSGNETLGVPAAAITSIALTADGAPANGAVPAEAEAEPVAEATPDRREPSLRAEPICSRAA